MFLLATACNSTQIGESIFYPPAVHDTRDGALLPGLAEVVAAQRKDEAASSSQGQARNDMSDSVFDMNQSAMHDSAECPEKLFEHARPTIVTGEGVSADE